MPLPPWINHRRAAILLIALFALAWAAYIHRHLIDFEVYLVAGQRVVHAENLYRPDDGHFQSPSLPAFAFPMAAFARMPTAVARLLWYAQSCGLLVTFVRWSVRELPGRNLKEPTLWWIVGILFAKFYFRELNLGQTNALLGVLLIGALRAARIDARWRAGVLVGLGVFVKVYALILLPWLLLAAGAAGLGAMACVISIGLLLPAAAYGWQGNIDQLSAWSRTVTESTGASLMGGGNISALTMWTKWTGEGPHIRVLAAATILLALGLLAMAVWRRRRVTDPLYLEFGLLMLLIPIISPQGWDYLLLLATPAIVLVIDRWRLVRVPWRVVTGLALFFLSFTVHDLLGRKLYLFLMGTSVQSVSALTLFVCLIHLRHKELA
jgi:hypothetical protein